MSLVHPSIAWQPQCNSTTWQSSVLRPRDPNVLSHRFMPAKPQKAVQQEQQQQRRQIKKAPLASSQQLRDDRRAAFLRRVRNDRDEKQFARRADDISRQRDLEQQRQWDAELARFVSENIDEEWEDVDDVDPSQAEQELQEIEEAEQRELEDLLQNMEETDRQSDHYSIDGELEDEMNHLIQLMEDDAMDIS